MRKIIFVLLLFSSGIIFGFGLILPQYEPGENLSFGKLEIKPYEAELHLEIIDNYVYTDLKQSFINRKKYREEGVFKFPLPEGMDIIGFATWDGPKRIPGVILEKQKAIRIYEELRARAIDPGILLPTARNLFTAKIAPIEPYSTKLVEIQFGGLLQEIDGSAKFLLPLSPGDLDTVKFVHLKISILVSGRDKIDKISVGGIPIELSFDGEKYIGEAELDKPTLTKSFIVEYSYANDANGLSVSLSNGDDDKIYGLALFSPPVKEKKSKSNSLILTDISASMEDNFEQIKSATIKSAELSGKFASICFNDSIYKYSNGAFVDFSKEPMFAKCLGDLEPAFGTDLLSVLKQGYKIIDGQSGRKSIILITDGVPTVGEMGRKAIVGLVKSHKVIPIYVVAIGEDVSGKLLEEIANISSGSVLFIPSGATGAETSDEVERVLKPFLQREITAVKNIAIDGTKLSQIYPESSKIFGGMQGAISFIVKNEVSPDAEMKLTTADGKEFKASVGKLIRGDFIPRLWAKHRVDYLLMQIQKQGERKEWVDEIVALSKKFIFVTPYTAFLAAPRAVLRPRIIQPSDPKLVIDAPTAVRVVVELPWGEQIVAQKNANTGFWEARFLVPQNVNDGEYECTLIITDKNGAQWQQRQKFVIDTEPPEIKAEIQPKKVHPGEIAILKVYAPQDTRKILAKTPDGKMLELHYDDKIAASTAKWMVPDIPAEKYKIKFVATDFAGNQTETESEIEVVK
ncbi:VWA domain-containing protein [bacterium]|nr:VWA domain-containing protein [bacterium]